MYLTKTPLLIQRLFYNLTWRVANSDAVYLTFDDGPVPEATPWVLDTLKEAGIKATFFCVGENVERYPEIYSRILEEGHTVGNHTQQHQNAWKTDRTEYLEGIDRASHSIDSKLYRPPYGKLTPSLIKELRKSYDIIMWDVLSGDFDQSIDADTCYKNVVDHASRGSVVVFHDSPKAIDKLKIVLPKTIAFFEQKGIPILPLQQRS